MSEPAAVAPPSVPSPPPPEGPPAPPVRSAGQRVLRWAGRCLRGLGLFLAGVVLAGLVGWAALAVCFAGRHGVGPRYGLAGLLVVAAVAGVVFARPKWVRWAVPVVAFGVVLGWFFSLKASNDRDWQEDVSRLAWADVNGDRVVVHNVRDFDYRAETDWTARWEDRTYDLAKLRTLDFMLVYWGSDAIAHGIVSFVFDDGQYLAVSIETRKEKGEEYSAVEGFFRQYELIYVFADERDVVRVRTEYRNEDVYLYHTRLSPKQARASLMSYLEKANELRDHPEWYNALTTNCVTSVLPHGRAAGLPGTMSLDVLLAGHVARQAYRNGVIDDSLPYEQLHARSWVNAKARAVDRDPRFSERIREGLPVPSGDFISRAHAHGR